MGERILGLIELLFGLGIVVAIIVVVVNYTPAGGKEFVAYSTLRSMCFSILGLGVVAGALLLNGIRGLLKE